MENFNIGDILAQAQAMQSQMQAAQEKLAAAEVTGTSGGGLVTATVQGTGELVGLVIKPEACDPEDTETLADLVVAAVRDAMTKIGALQEALLPQLPEMPDMGALGGLGGPGVPGQGAPGLGAPGEVGPAGPGGMTGLPGRG